MKNVIKILIVAGALVGLTACGGGGGGTAGEETNSGGTTTGAGTNSGGGTTGMKTLGSVAIPDGRQVAISPDGRKAYIPSSVKYDNDDGDEPGLRVVDITNPKKLKIEKIIPFYDEGRILEICDDIQISPDGKMLYSNWAIRTYGNIIYDIENDMQTVHNHEGLYVSSEAAGLSPDGKKLYTTAHTNGGYEGYLISMDSSDREKGLVDKASLKLTGSTITTDVDISKDGKLAYVVGTDFDEGGLFIVDVSDDKSLKIISQYKTSFELKEVVVSSDDMIAYVGSYGHGIDILDISNKKKPKFLYHLSGTGGAKGGDQVLLSKDNTKLFVAGGTALEAYNVHNPSSPKLLGKQILWSEDGITSHYSKDIALSPDESKIYATTSERFFVVDISHL